MICWDCKTDTVDFVMETRQVGGGGQGDVYPGMTYAGDFKQVPVHANRRDCLRARAEAIEAQKRATIPFYDVEPK